MLSCYSIIKHKHIPAHYGNNTGGEGKWALFFPPLSLITLTFIYIPSQLEMCDL